jgi:mitochondrial enoyl-[acyl-carrier protein] reductase / trans-2-enoyl-CoA reductase
VFNLLLQINPVAVYGLLNTLNIPKDGWVVFSAAGSGLARMGVHLAKHYGLNTIGIVRRDEQREDVVQNGADVAISSSSEDVVARIKEVTGGKVSSGVYAASHVPHCIAVQCGRSAPRH